MSLFEQYYRKEIKKDQLSALARVNPTARERLKKADLKESEMSVLMEGNEAQELKRLEQMAAAAKKSGGSSQHIDGRIKELRKRVKKKKAKIMKEAVPGDPMAGGPMPPPGGAPPPAPSPAGGPAKAFRQISVDAANFLGQKESELAGLPSDSPELAMVRNAEGLLREYTPEPGDDDKMVSSKIALLAKEMRNLEGGNSTGEVATYLRAFAGKIDEFRATIDVSDDGGEVIGEPPPEEAPPEKKAPEKEKDVPPSPEERQQDLATNLDLNVR